MSYDVAVVMPAYNEADGIGDFLGELAKAFLDVGWRAVFCLVDDASTDHTATRARVEAVRLGVPLHVECNPANRGHGPTSVAAWRMGLATDAPIIVHVDGDGQFEGAAVAAVAAAVTGDGAVGIRTTRADPWFRKLLSALLRIYMRILSGHSSVDPNSPLRAYRAPVMRRMLEMIPSQPMVPTVYLSALGRAHDLLIAEVSVASRPRLGTSATGTMWGGGRRLLPSRRLMSFVGRAAVESWGVLRAMRWPDRG